MSGTVAPETTVHGDALALTLVRPVAHSRVAQWLLTSKSWSGGVDVPIDDVRPAWNAAVAIITMPKRRKPKTVVEPIRIRPEEAVPDIVERIVPRRQVQVEAGDVVITRERVPRLNPHALFGLPWRYRMRNYPYPEGRLFTSFQNAASAAEQYATVHNARVLYVEDESLTVLADYRRR